MTFSGLEVLLISLGSATLGSIATIVGMLRWFPTQAQCDVRHKRESDRMEFLEKTISEASDCRREERSELISRVSEIQGDIKKRDEILFRMVRAMVSHMDLSKEQREYILNLNGNS